MLRKENIRVAILSAMLIALVLVWAQDLFVRLWYWIPNQRIMLSLRSRSAQDDQKESIALHAQSWNTSETAVVVVDMWDQHWCKGKTEDRINELAPAIDQFLTAARQKNIRIIHAPSDTLVYYYHHPSRKRSVAVHRKDIGTNMATDVLTLLNTERRAPYLIDQTHCPCEPDCKKGHPWTRQNEAIHIEDRDFILGEGYELWSILERWGIANVVLVGVHANGCILSRPFGLRNLVRSGRRVVLCRDLTDVMFDPRKVPFTHAGAMEYVAAYIEKYLCPTILSSDITQRPPFRFPEEEENLSNPTF